MKAYTELSKNELKELLLDLNKKYDDIKSKNLSLDMSRGKPCKQQLDLNNEMLEVLNKDSQFITVDGVDCRNYGILDGLSEMKELFAQLFDVNKDNVIVCGNASLNIMYDNIQRSYNKGVLGMPAWKTLNEVKFICVVPGYDRHFAILNYFGIKPINVEMKHDGPDMDVIETLVKNDESIKGIWCVPKYSNPTGNSYSDSIVKRLANLKPKAKDFRIYWDNSYAFHHLYDEPDEILNIIVECENAGNPNMVYEFASTSKISFAGAGVSCVISSKENIEDIKKQMFVQTIGYDKLNQLRHLRYYKNKEGIYEHMKKHADILRPKFEAVINILDKELSSLNIANWTKPRGGYFISFNTMNGCATKVVQKCKEAGVILTSAGATYPNGIDKNDKNIRIAPSYPSIEELKMAAELLALSTKIVSVEKLLYI